MSTAVRLPEELERDLLFILGLDKLAPPQEQAAPPSPRPAAVREARRERPAFNVAAVVAPVRTLFSSRVASATVTAAAALTLIGGTGALMVRYLPELLEPARPDKAVVRSVPRAAEPAAFVPTAPPPAPAATPGVMPLPTQAEVALRPSPAANAPVAAVRRAAAPGVVARPAPSGASMAAAPTNSPAQPETLALANRLAKPDAPVRVSIPAPVPASNRGQPETLAVANARGGNQAQPETLLLGQRVALEPPTPPKPSRRARRDSVEAMTDLRRSW